MRNNDADTRVILPDDFDERAAFEAPAKGWLSVLVETKDHRHFSVYFCDPVRLQQDLDENIRAGKPYFAEPGLIVVPEVTVDAVQEAVQSLFEQGFFDELRPQEIERARL